MLTKNIEYTHVKSMFLWFVPLQPDVKVLQLSEEDDIKADFSMNYDYERKSPRNWLIHIDVTMTIHRLAKTSTRTICAVKAKEEEVFVPGSLEAAVGLAARKCVQGFNEQCKAHGLNDPEIEQDVFEQYAAQYAEGFCEQYFKFRKQMDAANSTMTQEALHLSPGSSTLLTVLCTFKVLDEVMYCNPAFDNRRNCKLITDIVPEPKYNTLKLKSLELKDHDVYYSLFETTLLFILMDAALQLTVGDHFDHLEEPLKEIGCTAEHFDEYIRYTSGMMRSVKENFAECGARVRNLEVSYDWNALIS